MKRKSDPVSHPTHYTSGSVECIEAIKAALTPEEFRGFCKGSSFQYIWRAGLKSKDPLEDFKKAMWYLERLV